MGFEPIARIALFLIAGLGILFLLWVFWSLCQDSRRKRHFVPHHAVLGESEPGPAMPEEWHEVPQSRRAS